MSLGYTLEETVYRSSPVAQSVSASYLYAVLSNAKVGSSILPWGIVFFSFFFFSVFFFLISWSMCTCNIILVYRAYVFIFTSRFPCPGPAEPGGLGGL